MWTAVFKYTLLFLYLPFLAFGWWFGLVTVKTFLFLHECVPNRAGELDVICFSFSLMTVLAFLTGLLTTRTDFSKSLKSLFLAAAVAAFVFYGLFLAAQFILPDYIPPYPES